MADLVVVHISEEIVAPPGADRDYDFGETRLAGLIRQHSKQRFIFMLELSGKSNKTPEQVQLKLRSSLEGMLTGQSEIIIGDNRKKIFDDARQLTYKHLIKRLEHD